MKLHIVKFQHVLSRYMNFPLNLTEKKTQNYKCFKIERLKMQYCTVISGK